MEEDFCYAINDIGFKKTKILAKGSDGLTTEDEMGWEEQGM